MKRLGAALFAVIITFVFCSPVFAENNFQEKANMLIEQCFENPDNARFVDSNNNDVKNKVLFDTAAYYQNGNIEAIHQYLIANRINYSYITISDTGISTFSTERRRTVSEQSSHVFYPQNSAAITSPVEILFTCYNSFYYDITGGGHGGNVVSRLDGWRITIDAIDAPATFDPQPKTSGQQWIQGGKAYLQATISLYVKFNEHPADPGDDYGSYSKLVIGEALQ